MRRQLVFALLVLSGAACQQDVLQEELQTDAPTRFDGVEARLQRERFEEVRALAEQLRDPDACSNSGGNLERRGLGGALTCVTQYSDAGETCSDSSDCEGACLTYSADIQEGDSVLGLCQATEPTRSGCFANIYGGIADAPLCLN